LLRKRSFILRGYVFPPSQQFIAIDTKIRLFLLGLEKIVFSFIGGGNRSTR
jgi:hypothetical protein